MRRPLQVGEGGGRAGLLRGAPRRRGGVARRGVVSVPACLAASAAPEVGSASGGAGGAMAADTQVGAGRARGGGGPAVGRDPRGSASPHLSSPRSLSTHPREARLGAAGRGGQPGAGGGRAGAAAP